MQIIIWIFKFAFAKFLIYFVTQRLMKMIEKMG